MLRAEAEHLVRRTSFGVDWAVVDALVSVSRSDAVDLLLDFDLNPAPAPPADATVEGGTMWEQIRGLTRWWFERMLTVPRPLEEHLALFWHSHFAVNANKLEHAWQAADLLDRLRRGSLGTFDALLHSTSISPAMLLYLDNHRNEALRPNENYARELLELHTLSPGHYTEHDIIEAARAWSGHGLADGYRSYRFTPSEHDAGSKSIFGIVRSWDGPQVIDEIVGGVRREACARFVATKLWSYFAYPNPPSHVVDDLVVPYLVAGRDLRVLLSAIFTHDAFYGATARQGLVRAPVHWSVACTAQARLDVFDTQPELYVGTMGQSLFFPLTPEGWGNNAEWISPIAMWSRADFARRVANRMNVNDYLQEIVDQPVPTAVESLRRAMGIPVLSPTSRRAIEDQLAAERAAGSTDEFRNAVTVTLLSPEMQLA